MSFFHELHEFYKNLSHHEGHEEQALVEPEDFLARISRITRFCFLVGMADRGG